jgi:Anthrone oxygenase
MAGFSEPMALIATIASLSFVPVGTIACWTTLLAIFSLVGMQVVYWIFIHPVNKVWLKGADLKRPDAVFFAFDPLKRQTKGDLDDDVVWKRLRDRWEWSHVARAALAVVALLSLIVARTF